MYHRPALAEESISLLGIREGGTFVDLTFGGGGHSSLMLEKLGDGHLYAFDQDPDAEGNLPEDDRLTFIASNFRFFLNFLKYYKALPVDGILADLGVSSHQFDEAARGFSIRHEGPLDMRMDPAHGVSAADIIADFSEDELRDIFNKYGEVKNAARLANTIVKARGQAEISTTQELCAICKPLAPHGRENQYLAKVFQALRIAVNQEMEALEEMLKQIPDALADGGRVAIITYHSLEDRMVKHFLRSGRMDGKIQKDFYGQETGPFRLVTRKAVQPSEKELTDNPRVRSARLRVAEKAIQGTK